MISKSISSAFTAGLCLTHPSNTLVYYSFPPNLPPGCFVATIFNKRIATDRTKYILHLHIMLWLPHKEAERQILFPDMCKPSHKSMWLNRCLIWTGDKHKKMAAKMWVHVMINCSQILIPCNVPDFGLNCLAWLIANPLYFLSTFILPFPEYFV